jgi:hypothetical protein
MLNLCHISLSEARALHLGRSHRRSKSKVSFLLSLCSIVAIAVCSVAAPTAYAQDPLGGLALGIGLDNLGGKVEHAVQEAVAGGSMVVAEAGGQVSVAIQQSKAAYQHELEQTWQGLNAQEQQTINSLFSAANAFIDKTYTNLNEIEHTAQGVIHTLPFSKNFPQVWKFNPTYATPAPNPSVRVTVNGDFYDVPKQDYDATLTIGARTLKNAFKTSQTLSFDVPSSTLASQPNQVASNTLSIMVPYQERCWLVLKCKRAAHFQIPLMVLPERMGTVTITTTVLRAGTTTQNVTTTELFKQESGTDDIRCKGEHADQARHVAWPHSGWRVLPDSVDWILYWHQGTEGPDKDFWKENCSTPAIACQCVTTVKQLIGTSGKVHFWIKYTEEKDTNENEISSTDFPLGWGESRNSPLPLLSTWTGSYHRFDGKEFQFAGPYKDNFLWVTQTPSTVTLQSAPFDVGTMLRTAAAIKRVRHP